MHRAIVTTTLDRADVAHDPDAADLPVCDICSTPTAKPPLPTAIDFSDDAALGRMG